MNADAMTTRMSVLTRALPSRVLLVDDDELELQQMAGRLAAAGFEVTRAVNGKEALALLDRQWYPLLMTDWDMPVMDGIALAEALRRRGVDDTYIIMLTMPGASADYERGYVSGVDDYLARTVPDAELLARIHVAFNTLALRRSLKEARVALEQSAPIDAESGAVSARELQARLHSEIRRAQRYGRMLTVITLGVHAKDAARAAAPMSPALLQGIVKTINAVVRAHVDWTGRLRAANGAAFAIVLPEAGIADAPSIKERLLAAMRRYTEGEQGIELGFTFGVTALERSNDGAPVDPQEMIEVAEHCRPCNGRSGAEQLSAIQRSVAGHVALGCRHGYVVDAECRLKAGGMG